MGAVLLLAGSCSEPRRDYRSGPPPQPASRVDLAGRWVDLDDAVASACETADFAVLEVERWASVVRIRLVSDAGSEGTLVVVGLPDDEKAIGEDATRMQIRYGEIRLGSFRDAIREMEFLDALQRELRALESRPRLPGSN